MLDFKVTKKRSKILKRYFFGYNKKENVYKRPMLFCDAEIMKNNGNSYNYYYWSTIPNVANRQRWELTWAELRELLKEEYPDE